MRRVSEFDALRGLAALGVLMFHLRPNEGWTHFGMTGVHLFLVLSGYLITNIVINHVGSPNSLNCQNAVADPSWLTYVGPFGSAPATSNHPSGVNLALADGSVRFIKDSVNATVWWGLGTRNGREVLSSDAY